MNDDEIIFDGRPLNEAAAMQVLNKIIKKIASVAIKTPACAVNALEAWDRDYGIGCMPSMLAKYMAITDEDKPRPKCTIICCADHGVSEMQVSAYPQDTTLSMTTNYLISQGAAANALSNFIGSDLMVADLGIRGNTQGLPGLIMKRLGNGTNNSAKGPAMSRRQALFSIIHGIALAYEACDKGCYVLLPGEMGISNTTSSAAITAAICKLPAEEVTGHGTNISDERLKNKIAVVQQILDVNKPDPDDALDVLAKVGGFELGAIAGIIIGGASRRAMTILDGFNTGAAALIATTLCPSTRDYIVASHLSRERGHKHILKHLGLKPIMKLDLCLGEAIGSALAADILDMALELCKNFLYYEDCDKNADDYFHVKLPATGKLTLTDKTFNFYTNSIPDLTKKEMDMCRKRIDNLAKPIYSMGKLEELAVLLAGITDDKLPGLQQTKTLICFNPNRIYNDNKAITYGSSIYAGAKVYFGILSDGCSIANAFELGRNLAEKRALFGNIIGLAFADNEICDELNNALLNEDGSLKWDATDFLSHVPTKYQPFIAAYLGALLASAHSRMLIVLDNEVTVTIARYAALLCPDIENFIFNPQPAVYQLGITAAGGLIACLGMRLVEASLHMLNDMRTFSEAQVPTANDGPGLGIQK